MKIEIVSGEGSQGTVRDYTGKRCSSQIKRELNTERSGGDRWAFVQINGQRVDDRDIKSVLMACVFQGR